MLKIKYLSDLQIKTFFKPTFGDLYFFTKLKSVYFKPCYCKTILALNNKQ